MSTTILELFRRAWPLVNLTLGLLAAVASMSLWTTAKSRPEAHWAARSLALGSLCRVFSSVSQLQHQSIFFSWSKFRPEKAFRVCSNIVCSMLVLIGEWVAQDGPDRLGAGGVGGMAIGTVPFGGKAS